MTLTLEQSSNKERYEAAPTSEIVNIIRTAMSAGCIRPSHVYDAVDELICRIEAAAKCELNANSKALNLSFAMRRRCHTRKEMPINENRIY